ncbi:FF domain-containing protein [Croceicoccus naphthovorans]|uniref:FF domain-containing protein n=1 Tax=Croceicoccus naphthovorans TaxID=1348774 RepID=A0A0G3XJR5_9SPHN|nr:metal-dependent hydrolase [Croceicoccus naphthovorans]AKM11800.1 FF domain-containing protein [Croceicoccus naphthovorans]
MVRDRRFDRTKTTRRWWLNNDPYATAIFNSLSISFPRGEAFFIESVRAFRDDAPDQLAAQIRAFAGQEVNHSREHLAFNRAVSAAGYQLAHLDSVVAEVLAEARDRPPIANLAATMALEHFTAMFAHVLLSDPRQLAGADPEMTALWRWHSTEEIEHKAVAYDTWLHATRDWPRGKRWRIKAITMLIASRKFVTLRYRGAIELLRQDGITGWRAHRGVLRYVWLSPGPLRKIVPHWLAYFLPGFHPWNRDDSALIEQASD